MSTEQTGFPSEKRRVLAALPRIPERDDLDTLVSLAHTGKGEIFELPFRVDQDYFRVQTVVGRRAGEPTPTWYLYRGGGPAARLEWIHQLDDVDQVKNAIDESIKNGGQSDVTAQPKAEARPSFRYGYNRNNDESGANPVQPAPNRDVATGSFQMRSKLTKPGQGVFEGDLTRLPIEALLQSVVSGKMTGRLVCNRGDQSATLYLVAGQPFDGELKSPHGEVAGEEALIELATWSEGSFAFFPEQVNVLKTIHKRLESLLMIAVGYKDCLSQLQSDRIGENTILKKTAEAPEQMTKEVLDELRMHCNFDLDISRRLWEILNKTGSKNTIAVAKQELPVSRMQWVPVVFAWKQGGLIQALGEAPQAPQGLLSEAQRSERQSERPPAAPTPSAMASFLLPNEPALPHSTPIKADIAGQPPGSQGSAFDQAAFESFTRAHIYSEPGVMSYLAFLYFVEQESYRYECFQSPYSLVFVRARLLPPADAPQQEIILPNNARRELIERLITTKRKADILAHYQGEHLALLLPQTNSQGVKSFAGRAISALMSKPLSPEIAEHRLRLCLTVGLSSVPEDCVDWVSSITRMHSNQRRFVQ